MIVASVFSGYNICIYFAETMCDKNYIRCYKDQKAYCYWYSGFVAPILIYGSQLKKDIVFLYSNVAASQIMSETKSLGIAVKRKDKNGSQIICVLCSCMAGAYETCNRVIDCLYKFNYTNTKELCSAACTEQACT